MNTQTKTATIHSRLKAISDRTGFTVQGVKERLDETGLSLDQAEQLPAVAFIGFVICLLSDPARN